MGNSSSKKGARKQQQKEPPRIEEPQPEIINFQFINKDFSVHLLCPTCKKLMKNPLRLHPCAHTFCETCSPKKNGSCPQCAAKVKEVQKDLIGEGLVNELMVRCLNEECPWKGSFEDYKKFHKQNCKLKVGLQEWLKGMKNTLNQHVKPDNINLVGSESESKTEKKGQESKVLKLPNLSEQLKQAEIDWGEQALGKQLRKDL